MKCRFGLVALLFALGCEGDEKIEAEGESSGIPDDAGGDGGGGGDDGGSGDDDGTCTDDTDCGVDQICDDGECRSGDRNNDFEGAESIRFVESGDEDAYSFGYINPAGDRDYYAFEADGGEFVRITTYTDEEDDTKDTVVTLYRDNGKALTYANGHAAGGGVSDADSVVYAYIPEAGTYYILVEDDGTFYDDNPDIVAEGGSDYTYDLSLTLWGSHTDETDSMESPSSSINISGTNSWFGRGVALETEGDVDYISLNMEVDGTDLTLDGNYDLSGSEADPRVRLLRASTGEVLRDKRQNGLAGALWYPDIPSGDYIIEVSDYAGGGSADHWFFVHALARTHDSNYGWETEANDSSGMAEAMDQEPLETSSGNLYTVARTEGFADYPDDEDWFEVTSDYEDGRLVVCLNSTWYGATTAPTLEVYDSSGTLLGSDPGDTDSASYPTATVANVEAPTGTYRVRVDHPEGVGGSAGDWYRMLVYVASFEVTNYDCP